MFYPLPPNYSPSPKITHHIISRSIVTILLQSTTKIIVIIQISLYFSWYIEEQ